ncbi:MAG: DUF4115 domain-containing protein [Xanthomonadaceae bacterium]|nr:DUF4115 domain-containing protein [Xanthomonadaceae bacterium]
MHEDAEGVQDSGPRGPGYRLREARDRRGLSVGEVARSLKLDAKVIAALEGDDYAALPAPIFVKGYLAQYCKLLGLPADECIAEYERGIGGVAPPPLVLRRAAGEEISPGSSPVMLVSWLVALLAVVMVVLWWVASPEPEPVAATPVVERPAQRPVVVDPTPPVPEVEARALPRATVPAGVPASAPDQTRVRFEFEADSWAEVVDATGRRLFFDLARTGRVIEVSGVAPISVFLGNAPPVRITVDGRVFDQSRYVRSGNVARFMLGDDVAQATRR